MAIGRKNIFWPFHQCTPYIGRRKAPTFNTKNECVQTESSSSHQLDPSYFSPLVWWMVRHNWGWNLFHGMLVTTTYFLVLLAWEQIWLGMDPLLTLRLRTDSSNSYQLDRSNVSSFIWGWMVRQGWDWNSFSTIITAPWLLIGSSLWMQNVWHP